MVLPSKLNSESSYLYIVDILDKFKSDLEQALEIKITDEKIKESILLYNQIRKGLEELYLLRSENPAIISDLNFIYYLMLGIWNLS